MNPADLPRRYAAWSLDAAVLALAALALGATWMEAGWRRSHDALAAVADAMAARLLEALQAGTSPLALIPAWTADPAMHAAVSALAGALVATAWPPMLAFALLGWAYHTGFEASRWQATPGKRLLGLRVVDGAGARPGVARAALRQAAGLLSWVGLNLGHLMAARPPRRRAWHDAIAGARVVQVADPGTALPAWAHAWLLLQAVAAVAAFAWLSMAIDAATQAAFDRLL